MVNDTRLKLSAMDTCQNCFSPLNYTRSPYMTVPLSLIMGFSLAVCVRAGAEGTVLLYAVLRTCRENLPQK